VARDEVRRAPRLVEHLHQAVVEVGLVDRLGQVGRDPDPRRLGAVAALPERGEQHQPHPASASSSLIARARASPSISGIFMSRIARS
jgi:hypothetical protein